MPLLGWIAEDPLDRETLVIQANDKVFPTRDEQRIIRPIVGRRVVMKPIVGGGHDKIIRVIVARAHCLGDDVDHIPHLDHVPGDIDFEVEGFLMSSGIGIQNQPSLAVIHIVMEGSVEL